MDYLRVYARQQPPAVLVFPPVNSPDRGSLNEAPVDSAVESPVDSGVESLGDSAVESLVDSGVESPPVDSGVETPVEPVCSILQKMIGMAIPYC